jgi:hypothetical protein
MTTPLSSILLSLFPGSHTQQSVRHLPAPLIQFHRIINIRILRIGSTLGLLSIAKLKYKLKSIIVLEYEDGAIFTLSEEPTGIEKFSCCDDD